MHRPDLVKMLYDRLSDDDKARVLTRKDMIDIETQKDGIVVKCADGSEIKGSVVIGADGVHSQVRDAMRRLALKESPTAKVNDETPLLTSYRCLFGTASLVPGLYLYPGELWGGHGPKASTQSFVGKDKAWFFVYEELDKPTCERHKYSKQDVKQFAQKWGHLAISDTVKVKDLYAVSQDLTLTDLQEGVMKVFTWNRIGLVGDAVCKHTPNAGLGYNGGVQDLVAVVNGLYRLLHNHPSNNNDDKNIIDTNSIEAVFQQYQKEREKDSRQAWEGSYKLTRLQAFTAWGDWLMERWVIPKFNLGKIISQAAARRGLHGSKVLSFLEEKELVQGTSPWVYYPDGVKPPQTTSSNWGKLVVGMLIVFLCLWLNRNALFASTNFFLKDSLAAGHDIS